MVLARCIPGPVSMDLMVPEIMAALRSTMNSWPSALISFTVSGSACLLGSSAIRERTAVARPAERATSNGRGGSGRAVTECDDAAREPIRGRHSSDKTNDARPRARNSSSGCCVWLITAQKQRDGARRRAKKKRTELPAVKASQHYAATRRHHRAKARELLGATTAR